jgi:uncharacterized membrane-anchored protein YhcB (DUF1043 family)
MNADDLATQLHRAQDKIARLQREFDAYTQLTATLMDAMSADYDRLKVAYDLLNDHAVEMERLALS